jgi:electron transfer flavoprotein beta subunit
MKVLVAVKRVVDFNVKIRVKTDGSGVETANVKMSMNPFDEIANEEAIRLREAGTASEVIAVSLGEAKCQETLRTALAMGADRAIHVVTNDAELDSLVVVKVLAGIVAAEKPDLVIMGKQAVDGDANQVAQMLAGKLGWAQATFAASIEVQGDRLLVGREVDGGVEYKSVPKPSVISVDLRIVASKSVKNGITPDSHTYSGEGARLPSLKGIMAAKKKPLATAKLADYGAEPASAIKELSVTLPPPRAAGQIVADIPTLVKKLADEAKAL